MSVLHLPHSHDNQKTEDLLLQLSNIRDFEIASDIFKQLGDSSRLRIFWLLCHCEECVVNISALVDMTSPAVSHHLRQLKASGLVVSKRNGKEVFYKAADTEQSQLLHLIIEKILEIVCPSVP